MNAHEAEKVKVGDLIQTRYNGKLRNARVLEIKTGHKGCATGTMFRIAASNDFIGIAMSPDAQPPFGDGWYDAGWFS